MVLAPEHPLVERLTTPQQRPRCRRIASRPRARAISTAPIWPKTRPASSPARTPSIRSTRKPVPIWIADYVLISYGTGAIMAVPAHDTRDFRIRQAIRSADRARRRSRQMQRTSIAAAVLAGDVAVYRRRHGDQLRRLRRPADRRVQTEDHRRSGRPRASAARRSTTSCATGSSAGSIFGASRFRSCTSWTPRASRPACSARSPEKDLPVDLPEMTALQAARPPRAAAGRSAAATGSIR